MTIKEIYEVISIKFVGFVDIDFETRSILNVKDCGAWVYANHPSTEILLMRYSIEGGKIHGWRIGDPFPKRLARALEKGFQIRAHNWLFEYCIWRFVAVKKLGWPELHYTRFDCTAALANRYGFPNGLEQAGDAMGLPVVKDKKGKLLITKFSTPSRRKGHEWNEPEDFPEAFNDFDDYCDIDVQVQQGIVRFVPALLEKSEMDIFRLTQLINIRGIPIDLELCHAATKLKRKAILAAVKKAKRITNGIITNIRSRDEVMAFLDDNGCPLVDMQAETIEKTLRRKDLKPIVRQVLELKTSAGKTSVSKFNKAVESTHEGTIHGGVLYYGAAKTGRFAGRQIQPHNFARPTVKKFVDLAILARLIKEKDFFSIEIITGNVMEALSSSLRSMIAAPKGFKLVVADYSQIEARMVFWFANEVDALEAFERGDDIYRNTACDIYSKTIDMIDDVMRFVGKQAVLGLGFQMAHIKFRNQCIKLANIDVGEALAKKVVKFYRNKYKKVPELWKELNTNAIKAIQFKGKKFYCANKKVYYIFEAPFLICVLPSGRKLYYPFAEIKMTVKWGKEVPELRYKTFEQSIGSWVTTNSYGGKLLENIAQSCARDVMCNGMHKAEKAGYKNFLNVHDEVITLVKDNFGSVSELEDLLCDIPIWAKGFPAAAEGYESRIYKKG